ncbi:MAG: hypothetical protein GY730_02710 [bacterium]|nr:hypothetical protein [bacterium]
MKDSQQQSFYMNHIPQSEYRRLRKGRAGKLPYQMDIAMESLGIKDEADRKAVREKIKLEGEKIVKSILPESIWESFFNSSCFEEIYRKLDIL